ncbi:MAG TPA: arsenate reductase ArsC [Candidatus Dormibacteraeota bacterium]|nr:arsenate reductase ArsC [Candidatus Dormibacteraeota bacterium]
MAQRILILCTGNSARSQMAEGLLRFLSHGSLDVHSAGTKPVDVNPFAIEAMREIGVDISAHRSKSVAEFAGQKFDTVITVCDSAAEHCPVFPGSPQRIHWSLPDPAAVPGSSEERRAAFRQVRMQLESRLREFLASVSRK